MVIDFSDRSKDLPHLGDDLNNDVTIVVEEEIPLEEEKKNFLKTCILLIKRPHSIVLIDNENRIRGYYDADDRDELDRLKAEINIILKKY